MTDEIGEVESPQTTEATDFSDASTDDIREALGLTPEPSETPEGETEPTEGGEPTPETEQVSPQEVLEEGSEEERLGKRRIRPRTAEDQQVIDLYRSEGFQGSFDDASRIIYGQQHQPQAQQPAAELPPDEVKRRGEDLQAETLMDEIQGLEKQVEEAAENLETGQALQLQRDIMKKEMLLQNMRSERQRQIEYHQQHQFETHRQKSVESRDRAFTQYPDLADNDNVVRKQFDDYVAAAQQHPDYAAVFESPMWPELLAGDFASRAGMQAGQQPQAPQAPPQQAPVLGNQAKVLTSGSVAQPANSQPTAQQVVQNLPNLSRDDLYTALGQPDGRRHLQ